MDGVVDLDIQGFRAAFPELASLSDAQLGVYWKMAQSYCDNTPSSVITDWSPGGDRETCLRLMVAHIATLFGFGPQGDGRAGLVGRIASASQGSVSVAVEMPSSPNAAWYMQTQYGAMFWQLTAPYRTMHYF
jgi:hypothetical protein